ncbi:MAG: TetR family transcriptional regulator [Sphingomonadales bacterium]|nr:TetR family transcriptional regulator [Sphingomonadales bacterium]
MARYTEGHKQNTRDRILRHAAALLENEAECPPRIQQVMAHAGLTHGAFYAHFRSKADFLSAALDEALEAAEAGWRDLIASAPAGRQLEALVEACLVGGDDPPASGGQAALMLDIPRTIACARERIAARDRRMVARIARHLPAGGQGPERAERAHMIFAAIVGTREILRAEPAQAQARRARLRGILALANRPWRPA